MADTPTPTLSPADSRTPPHRVLGRMFMPPQQLAAIALDPELEREADRIGLRVVLHLAQHGYEIRTAGAPLSGVPMTALAAAMGEIDELKADLAAARTALSEQRAELERWQKANSVAHLQQAPDAGALPSTHEQLTGVRPWPNR